MAPSIEGRTHTFSEHGLYDGLFLMRDEESGTFWDHMTGEAVYGPLVGTSLEIENLRQTTVAQVLREDPEALAALSDRTLAQDDELKLDGLLARVRGSLSRFFSSTIDEEDDRRPTMDLGLGIWGGEAPVYYPYDVVLEVGNALIDRYDGRGLVVYLDPTARALAGYFTEAESFEWDDAVLRLSDGTFVEEGVLRGADGERISDRRPLQVFTRWYGFSLTFPGVAIYDGG
jgi:PAS domain-containing protein